MEKITVNHRQAILVFKIGMQIKMAEKKPWKCINDSVEELTRTRRMQQWAILITARISFSDAIVYAWHRTYTLGTDKFPC